jgi:tetratricopeptide (TPR) repeat protein
MAQLTIQQAFDLALQHHRAGRLREAEQLYRQILAQKPEHADAMHLLGVLAHQVGRNDVAVGLIHRAIALNPNNAKAHSNLGSALKDNGQLDEAVAACRRAIALNPNLPEAHNNLGGVLKDKGQLDEAIAAYRRAIALKPNYPEAHNNLGVALKEKGQLDGAITAYRQAIAFNLNLPEAHNNLGIALKDNGHLDEALTAFRQAIALNPNFPEAHSNLGNALREKGQLDEALAACRRAIALRPNYSEAYSNLGNALASQGELDEAIAAYRQAIAFNSNLPEAHYNLGNVLKDKGQLDGAIAAYRQAIAFNPNLPEAHGNLGNALKDKGQLDEAIAAFRQAIALNPNFPEAHYNLGNVLKDKGQLDGSIAACRQAIALRPDYADAHFNLSLSLLANGCFQQGWEEYEWRWKCKDLSTPRNFAQPQWDGRPLEGRTILLYTEQGFGDALQFMRYLPLVAERGGRIIVECQAELQRILQTIAGKWQVVARGQPLPAFDLHCPLLSLPRVFGTNLANVPNIVPYLHADAEDASGWQHRLADYSPRVKVGLAWAGSPTHTNDRNRSIKLARLAPLGRAPGVRFFSLQKGAAAAEARTPPPGMELVDWTQDLKDFAGTAALIANLDLVIAVDTAVVHLAGAMGKPVWTLLPYVPDWRWLMGREDSPWYPTMRFFRQPSRGEWAGVVQRVADALRGLR